MTDGTNRPARRCGFRGGTRANEGAVVVKFFNEGLMFACAVAFVLSTIAGLVG